MVDNRFLKKQGKEKIGKYVLSGILKSTHVANIIKADCYADIIAALSSFLEIDMEKSQLIWRYVIDNIWIGVKTDQDTSSCFDEYECIFFRELLRSKGTITREYCIKKVFKTPHISDRVTRSLEEMGIIDSFKLRNWEVVYVLNLNFYKEVFKDVQKANN